MANQVPTAAKVKELLRELAMRRNVYPDMVARGALAGKEADWRIEVMEAILADYRQRQRTEQP